EYTARTRAAGDAGACEREYPCAGVRRRTGRDAGWRSTGFRSGAARNAGGRGRADGCERGPVRAVTGRSAECGRHDAADTNKPGDLTVPGPDTRTARPGALPLEVASLVLHRVHCVADGVLGLAEGFAGLAFALLLTAFGFHLRIVAHLADLLLR